MTDATNQVSAPRKRGRPRTSAGDRHLVTCRLTPEHYKALTDAARDNKRSISEQLEQIVIQWPVAAKVLEFKDWFDPLWTDRIKQLEAYNDELRRERNGAIQALIDLQGEPTLSEDAKRALDRAMGRILAKTLEDTK